METTSPLFAKNYLRVLKPEPAGIENHALNPVSSRSPATAARLLDGVNLMPYLTGQNSGVPLGASHSLSRCFRESCKTNPKRMTKRHRKI